MHIKRRQFFREVDSPSVTVFTFWCLVNEEASVLFHDCWKETTHTDTIAAHDDWHSTAIFIQDICTHTCWVASTEFEDVTNLDPTRKVENTLSIWRDFTLTHFTDIHIVGSKVATWIHTRQVVTILVSTHNSIAAILHFAICNNFDSFWKIDWTKRTKVSSQ